MNVCFPDSEVVRAAPTQAPDELKFGYVPRKQFVALHQRSTRWACMVAHRRSGKTVASVNEMVIRALYSKKHNPRYAYIAPFYSQAKNVAWTYLKDATRQFITSARDVRESELSVTLFNGAVLRLYGADNPDALRGVYHDGVVLDEFGDCRPALWGEVILPTLADRKGWAIFIGTPKGKNHFWEIHQRSRNNPDDWFSLTLKASESGILPMVELQAIRDQTTDSEYAQEFECDFTAAVKGTYYADLIQQMELDGQITDGTPEWDPNLPVSVAADLGYKDSTALWFWQVAQDGIAIIDYEEHRAQTIEFYGDLLRDKPYKYDTVWLPHDARAKTLRTGRSTVEQFLSADFPINIAPNLKRQQGIDAARMVLKHCFFNRTKCYSGIEALRSYRRTYNQLTKQFSKDPLHDWASDGADAFRYLALVARLQLPAVIPQLSAQQRIDEIFKPTPPTLDQLFEDREFGRGKFQFQKARFH